MQHTVGRGTQQQRQTMSTMTSNYDEIRFQFVRQAVDFAVRAAKNEVATFGGQAVLLGEIAQVALGLFVYLVLYRGDIHWYISAIGKAQGFNDVHRVQLC